MRLALLEGELPPALPLLDLRQRRADPQRHAVLLEPAGHDLRAGLVDHARQDARRDLDDGQRGAAREDGVQDREGDEARADHDDLGARLDGGDDGARLVERPEGVDARARRRPSMGGRAAREPVAIRQSSYSTADAVVERELPRPGVERLGAAAEHGLDLPRGERGGGRGVDVGLGDGGAEVVRQDHAGIGALGGHEGDLGRAAVLFPNGPDRVEARRAAADDQMAGGITRSRGPARAWSARPRSRRSSPPFSPSTKVIASVGQASAQAGCPSQRLHL